MHQVTLNEDDEGYERSDTVMFDLNSMVARERSCDLLTEAERERRSAQVQVANRMRFRDGRRVFGHALIRAGQAISGGAR